MKTADASPSPNTGRSPYSGSRDEARRTGRSAITAAALTTGPERPRHETIARSVRSPLHRRLANRARRGRPRAAIESPKRIAKRKDRDPASMKLRAGIETDCVADPPPARPRRVRRVAPPESTLRTIPPSAGGAGTERAHQEQVREDEHSGDEPREDRVRPREEVAPLGRAAADERARSPRKRESGTSEARSRWTKPRACGVPYAWRSTTSSSRYRPRSATGVCGSIPATSGSRRSSASSLAVAGDHPGVICPRRRRRRGSASDRSAPASPSAGRHARGKPWGTSADGEED